MFRADAITSLVLLLTPGSASTSNYDTFVREKNGKLIVSLNVWSCTKCDIAVNSL